ncbi:replication protein A 70 kDa DNA-binding subunit E-like [Helianthus annuus]|uniref:replication protein A 70 kDa DNA-binding subunit E-like n=1 Tax=Helianthus annuus TaxID=4232 RepID=UPI000B8EEEC3|nr:replication protein A 70 kDa DNA-binding subunit E-like [Helianthus annuus]
MDENNVTFLNNLDWRSKLFTIKIKVLRLWIRVNPKREGEILGTEMVVMDEQGTRMQATVWSKFMKKHEILLYENESYNIYKSQLSVIKSNFKHFDKEHTISLNFDTSVKKCENFDGSLYGIRLASFESIKSGEVDVKFRVDFIGYVDEWSETEMTKTKMGKDSKYMNLQLLDEEGIKLNCTLWDEYCDEMFGYIQSHKEEVHVVLLVQFGSFNKEDDAI